MTARGTLSSCSNWTAGDVNGLFLIRLRWHGPSRRAARVLPASGVSNRRSSLAPSRETHGVEQTGKEFEEIIRCFLFEPGARSLFDRIGYWRNFRNSYRRVDGGAASSTRENALGTAKPYSAGGGLH